MKTTFDDLLKIEKDQLEEEAIPQLIADAIGKTNCVLMAVSQYMSTYQNILIWCYRYYHTMKVAESFTLDEFNKDPNAYGSKMLGMIRHSYAEISELFADAVTTVHITTDLAISLRGTIDRSDLSNLLDKNLKLLDLSQRFAVLIVTIMNRIYRKEDIDNSNIFLPGYEGFDISKSTLYHEDTKTIDSEIIDIYTEYKEELLLILKEVGDCLIDTIYLHGKVVIPNVIGNRWKTSMIWIGIAFFLGTWLGWLF